MSDQLASVPGLEGVPVNVIRDIVLQEMRKRDDKSAKIQAGKSFWRESGGAWAGQQLMAALRRGEPLNASQLRTLDSLRKDEWKAFDDALIEEGTIRLRGVADLIAAGLTIPVANALGKTILEWEKVTDMDPASISLDGLARTDLDTVEFDLDSIPLPIIHKDFDINLRRLAASRERGESLDTTKARVAGRLVSEKLESVLFNGGPIYGGKTIYGYTNHPNRNTASFGAGAWSAGARTGTEILTDVLTAKAALEADRFYGPYWVYIPSNTSTKFDEDFKTNSDKTIRERILEVDGIDRITTVDQLTADNIVFVQGTRDVVALVDGEGLQTVQWDLYGGFRVAFKAFTIQVPLIRADAQGRSGVFHLS